MVYDSKLGNCDCLHGTAYWGADGTCRCDDEPIVTRYPVDPRPVRDSINLNPNVNSIIPTMKPLQHRPLGGGGGIRMKPEILQKRILSGQANDYYNQVDPRIYQTGGAMQTGTMPSGNNPNNARRVTSGTAGISNQLANFYNQNKTLVLIGAAGLVYMLAKKK